MKAIVQRWGVMQKVVDKELSIMLHNRAIDQQISIASDIWQVLSIIDRVGAYTRALGVEGSRFIHVVRYLCVYVTVRSKSAENLYGVT
jgi:hypothetical protein